MITNAISKSTVLFIVVFIVIWFNSSFAQNLDLNDYTDSCGWSTVLADTNAMFGSGGIYFTSANTGYVVGSKIINQNQYPRIEKTTDAGSTWSYLTTPLNDSLLRYFRYVFFTDANTGYVTSATNTPVAEENGKILKTTDAGNTWSIYTPSVNKHMTCIWFVNSSTGFATGLHTILKTTNAGSSWELSLNAAWGAYLFGIYFINVNTGFVVGNWGYIYKTTDSGNNWTYSQAHNYDQSLWSVWFTNDNTGFVVGGHSSCVGNKIFRTTDCGNTWDSIAAHPEGDNYLYSVRFVNSNTGFITGRNQIFKTTDGGLNWRNLCMPIPYLYVHGSYFTSPETGYLAGYIIQPVRVGYVCKTTSGGEPIAVKSISNQIPEKYSLSQNYPNPFNPVTKITFALPKPGDVKLILFDVLGREVAVLVDEKLRHGTYEVDFDGTNYPSGVYLYRLSAGDYSDAKKMVMIK